MSEQLIDSTNLASAQPQLVEHSVNPTAQFSEQKPASVSRTQAAIDVATSIFSSATYFICVLMLASAWIWVNLYSERHGLHAFDPLPFALLQGLLGLNGVLIIIAVLLRHHRTHKFHNAPLEHSP